MSPTTGQSLKNLRQRKGFSQRSVVETFNRLASENGLNTRITERQLRRWERMHTQDYDATAHGSTPATLQQLQLLLIIYGASADELIETMPRDPIVERVCNTVRHWPDRPRRVFLEFFEMFIQRF